MGRPVAVTMLAMLIGVISIIHADIHAETLRFALLPMEDHETVINQFRPMTTYLEKHLGVTIEFQCSEIYSEILEQFRRSQIDLAYLGPMPYVTLRKSYPQAEPLVHFNERSGQATYTCALVTFPDAVFDIYDASNRKIALTQPLSTCGYLAARELMHRNGSELNRNYFRYLNQHDTVALSVVRGEFDAGCLKTAIGKKYTHLGLQILAETPPLPSFTLVANTRTLSAELISRIRMVLPALDPHGKDRELLSAWGDNIRYGAVSASDGNFDVIREMIGQTGIPPMGNF